MEKAIALLLALLLFNIAASTDTAKNEYEGLRIKREAEELEPYEYTADFIGEFEDSPRLRRDLDELNSDETTAEDFEPRIRRDLEEQGDDVNEETVRLKRESRIFEGDILTMPSPKMPEWFENGTHRINQFTKLAFLLSNDIPAKIVFNVFQNSTHKTDFMTGTVTKMTVNTYLPMSIKPLGYQIVQWYYNGMIKTDTFRELKTPIMDPVYNSSIKYMAPNYTALDRNDTKPQYVNYNVLPQWVFNGTHLASSHNRVVYTISDPNTGILVSNWFSNASHQIDFVNNKVYAFAPSHYSPMKMTQQIITWFIPSNGLIKTDTYRELTEPVSDVDFNLSAIYFEGRNSTSFYKNESFPRKKEWSYNGTHLVNAFNAKMTFNVPSPVEAVIVNNVFNNITHQTDFLTKKTYPVRNEMVGKHYQTISWYFNGLIRVDTLRNLQEPIIDPVFDMETIYFEDPNSTYIYKNESKPATYVPPNLVPEWLFNGTHVNNVLKRIYYPIVDPNAADITNNWFYNATHKIDLLNKKTYSTDVKATSTTPTTGYQMVNCRFKGIIRSDTYKELYQPIAEPNCNLKVIYNMPPNKTHFYVDEMVSILPVKQPEWSFNGTHKINTYTKIAYPVDNIKPPPPKEEWIFNGTHKVNLLTKESYPVEPERPMPLQPEWTYNGTHKINTYTKKAYLIDVQPVPQPKDEWTFNGTHKVNLMTKEAYPVEPERPLPVQQEWIFNGTHKINTYTKKAYPIDTIAPQPPHKDQWTTSNNEKPQPPKNEWVFNGTHKVNEAMNIAYPVEPQPDASRPKTADPPNDKWIEPGKPDHIDEWIHNGTHKVNIRTKEAHAVLGFEKKEQEYVKPVEPPQFKEHQPDVFTFNGTHKVNYHTKEAYPVGEIGVKPPHIIEEKREQNGEKLLPKPVPDMPKPVENIPKPPTSIKDHISLPVNSAPAILAPIRPSAPMPDKVPTKTDHPQKSDPKLPVISKPAVEKPAAPKVEETKTTKKSQQDVKVKSEPKVKCAGENFNDAQYCCQSNNVEEFFSKKDLLSCNNNKPNSKLFSYAKEYVLNKFQTLDNPIDFRSPYIVQKLQETACFANCLVKRRVKAAFSTTSKSLNADALGEYLNQKVKRGKSEFVSDHFNYCKRAAENVTKESTSEKCSLYSLVILQCLHRRLSTECSKPEGSPECTTALQKLRKCDPLPPQTIIAKSVQKAKIGGRMSQQGDKDDKEKVQPIVKNKTRKTKKKQG